MKNIITLTIIIAYSFSSFAQDYNNFLSVDIKHQALNNGKLFTAENKTLYNGKKEEITCYYHTPTKFYKTINSKGEVTIYMPNKNTVSFTHNTHYSSKNELVYYFVSNKTEDLGLRNEGFSIKSSKYEDNNLIVTWKAPINFNTISEVDIVYENSVPIFSEYRDIKNKIIRKTYYYEYYLGSFFNLPQKITEISYTPKNDSIVKRTTLSNIKLGDDVDRRLFNFEIPSDAIKVEQ